MDRVETSPPRTGTSEDVLERVERLHLHLTAVAAATTTDDIADVLVHAATELTHATCARLVLGTTTTTRACGDATCGICVRSGATPATAPRWRVREGELVVGTPGTTDVADRLVAWLVEQASAALDRARQSESAAATVDALLRSEKERTELVEVLAHDLRSPMTALHGFASLLADRWGDLDEDRRRDLLAMIQRETGRMNRLVDDVTNAVLGPTTQLPLRLGPVEAGALAHDLVVAAQAASPQHRVRCVVAPGTPAVHADADRLAQVLSNLLENVTRHTPEGTITLVHVGRDGDRVRLTVADDGPGVDPANADHVFHRGQRGQATTRPGSGLGLHTARELARAMGGELELAPDGPGATFVLTLPAAGVRAV